MGDYDAMELIDKCDQQATDFLVKINQLEQRITELEKLTQHGQQEQFPQVEDEYWYLNYAEATNKIYRDGGRI